MSDLPRVVVLASGRGSNYQALQQACENGRLPAIIPALICDRSGAAALDLARQAGTDAVLIERRHFQNRDAFEHNLADTIEGFAPRYIALAGFMRVLGPELVNRFAGRMINIHPSLLPRHRGLDTHKRALEAGDTEHGASVHFVTPELDGGPVISQVRMPLKAGDTPDQLAERLLPLEHRLYVATLALLLNYPVEYRHEKIYLDHEPLESPLVLDRHFGNDGRIVGERGRVS